MKTNSIRYLTREGFRNIRSNLLMSFASITVLLSCLVIIGCALLLFFNINSMLDGLMAQNIIKVFMYDESEQEDIDTLKEKLNKIENVASLEYISPEDAFEAVKIGMDDIEDILDGLMDDENDNFLPPSFNVTLTDLALYDQTVQEIDLFDEVESIRGSRETATNLEKLRNAVINISVAIIAILFFVAVFIIANTVRITMFSRSLEINIMKAVGATKWFIRWPFLIEGVVIGLISSLFSFGVIYMLYSYVISSKDSFADILIIFGGDVVPFAQMSSLIIVAFLTIGVFTGAFGSIISMGRYLREKGSVIYDENEIG